jgi:hypothetical protein
MVKQCSEVKYWEATKLVETQLRQDFHFKSPQELPLRGADMSVHTLQGTKSLR